MEQTVFIINNRFFVNNSTSEVLDNQTGQRIRLEPRLMKLLCLLVSHKEEVITRAVIVKEIWDDYPGANDSLNQAVSYLRKLLMDQDKKVIQTHPKAGYRFHALISTGPGVLPERKKNLTKRAVAIGTLFMIILFIVLSYFHQKDQSTPTMKERGEIDAAGSGKK
ncbi:MAG TPA: helix-turn-helix domain-containing protein [Chryseolinea sp.]|nr:helix-turn-helix domain-containing protein [Chryseolinea sp.]